MNKKFLKTACISAVVATCLILLCTTAFAAFMLGDLDLNGKITAMDARLLLRHSAKLELLDDSLLTRADVNLDKKINASDARLVLRVASRIDKFPEIEEPTEEQVELEKNGDIYANKMPYTVKGLKLESISYNSEDNTAKLIIRNTTGNAVSDFSYISYKTYDATGVLIRESSFSVRDMNNNETCIKEVSLHKDTAKIVFYDAHIVKSEFVPSYTMTTVDGKQVNKFPLDLNGVVIKSISFDDKYSKSEMVVSNTAGYPISSDSYVSYKVYDANGYIINSKDVYLEEMNNNENAIVDFYYDKDIKKIVFYASKLKKSDALYQGEMVTIDGIGINKLPYMSNGISIENASYDQKYKELKLTIRNKQKFAVSDYSLIEYKVYNAENFVIKSSSVSTTHLNSLEKCQRTLYLPDGASKIVFGKVTYKEAETYDIKNFTVYDNITVNTLPYTTNGLKIESVTSGEYGYTYVKVRNTTGKPISANTYLEYKCYNADGIIISASIMSLCDVNNNETMMFKKVFPKDTVKVVFYNSKIYERDTVKSASFSTYGDVVFNTCPTSINGLTIDKATYDASTGYLYATVVNNTGENLKDTTYLIYRTFDKDGNITGSYSKYIERLNKNYQCEVKFYVNDEVAKIQVYDAKIYVAE